MDGTRSTSCPCGGAHRSEAELSGCWHQNGGKSPAVVPILFRESAETGVYADGDGYNDGDSDVLYIACDQPCNPSERLQALQTAVHYLSQTQQLMKSRL